jgi:hypothetical protein
MRHAGDGGRDRPIDGSVVDKLKAALGAGREVVVYAAGDPNASTFMAATGARLAGPCCPRFKVAAGLATGRASQLEVEAILTRSRSGSCRT